MSQRDSVSIIVAVRNAVGTIQACIESIASQRHPHCELIVLDGASTDGTRELLNEDRQSITHLESRSDRGLYHAWNKGLALATGTWVSFLGADDRFAHPNAVGRLVAEASLGRTELVAARVGVVDGDGRIMRTVGEPWDWLRMKRHQLVAHPGMLHRRDLFTRFGGFDERLRIAGDYEFLLRVGTRVAVGFVDEVLVLMGSSGMSRNRPIALFKESWIVQSRHPEIGRVLATAHFAEALSKWTARRLLGRP